MTSAIVQVCTGTGRRSNREIGTPSGTTRWVTRNPASGCTRLPLFSLSFAAGVNTSAVRSAAGRSAAQALVCASSTVSASIGLRPARCATAGGEPQRTSKSSSTSQNSTEMLPVPNACQGAGPSRVKSRAMPASRRPNARTATPARTCTANANTGSKANSASSPSQPCTPQPAIDASNWTWPPNITALEVTAK